MGALRTFLLVLVTAWVAFATVAALWLPADLSTLLYAALAWLVISLPVAAWLAFGQRPPRLPGRRR
jgi:hypothetical protein